MRALLLAVLLLPGAAAWSVTLDAPDAWASGIPFVARACVDAPADARVELKVDLLLDGGRVGHAGVANRYAPGEAGCQELHVEAEDVEGNATLVVKARPAGGQAKARAEAPVALAPMPVAVDDGGALMPVRAGPAPRLVVAEVWGAPFSGVVLRNDGDAEARLLHHSLAGAALPDARVPPGGALFVGERAPPHVDAHAPLALRIGKGDVELRAANRLLSVSAERADARLVAAVAPRTLHVAGNITALALPHAGVAPLVALLDDARAEVLLEAYTITSPEVGAALLRALDRGVRVRALLEGAPVGGVPAAEGALVAALVARGADVAFMEGAPGFAARYRTVHAKLIVVDEERALVSTDNLHATSFPAVPDGSGSRGFALIVENATLARALADVVRADLAPWPDARPADVEALPPPDPSPPAPAPTPGPTARFAGAWNVTPVLSPGGADLLAQAMGRAERRIDAAVLFADARFGADENPLLEALVDAARRNVTVRLLLDGHVDDARNKQVAARLNALAAREGLPLAARVDAAARTLHAKALVLDGAAVYVGSMNWGRASAQDNREVGLLVGSRELAAWLQEEFEKDWAPAPAHAASREETPMAGAGWMVVATVVAAVLRRAARHRPRCSAWDPR